MATISTPSRPSRSSTASPQTFSSPPTISAFSQGAPAPLGYSYLNRSPTMITSTRKGDPRKVVAEGRQQSLPRFPTALRHSPPLLLTGQDEEEGSSISPASRALLQTSTSTFEPPQSVATLPDDARQWSSAQVALYLSHIFQNVPGPISATLSGFVKSEPINGRAFLRLRDGQLAEKGMNPRWRGLLLEASRRLRRDCLRKKLWGPDDAQRLLLNEIDFSQDDFRGVQMRPIQKRIMTATFQRIKNRKQVQGLIRGFEQDQKDGEAARSSPREVKPLQRAVTHLGSSSEKERGQTRSVGKIRPWQGGVDNTGSALQHPHAEAIDLSESVKSDAEHDGASLDSWSSTFLEDETPSLSTSTSLSDESFDFTLSNTSMDLSTEGEVTEDAWAPLDVSLVQRLLSVERPVEGEDQEARHAEVVDTVRQRQSRQISGSVALQDLFAGSLQADNNVEADSGMEDSRLENREEEDDADLPLPESLLVRGTGTQEAGEISESLGSVESNWLERQSSTFPDTTADEVLVGDGPSPGYIASSESPIPVCIAQAGYDAPSGAPTESEAQPNLSNPSSSSSSSSSFSSSFPQPTALSASEIDHLLDLALEERRLHLHLAPSSPRRPTGTSSSEASSGRYEGHYASRVNEVMFFLYGHDTTTSTHGHRGSARAGIGHEGGSRRAMWCWRERVEEVLRSCRFVASKFEATRGAAGEEGEETEAEGGTMLKVGIYVGAGLGLGVTMLCRLLRGGGGGGGGADGIKPS